MDLKKRIMPFAIVWLALFIYLVLTVVIHTPAHLEGKTDVTLWYKLQHSGTPGYLFIFLTVVLVAVAIECVVSKLMKKE